MMRRQLTTTPRLSLPPSLPRPHLAVQVDAPVVLAQAHLLEGAVEGDAVSVALGVDKDAVAVEEQRRWKRGGGRGLGGDGGAAAGGGAATERRRGHGAAWQRGRRGPRRLASAGAECGAHCTRLVPECGVEADWGRARARELMKILSSSRGLLFRWAARVHAKAWIRESIERSVGGGESSTRE